MRLTRPVPVPLRPLRSLTVLFTTTLALLAALLLTNARPFRADAAGVVTVCIAGPPTCAFASIQSAIEVAAAGDILIVDAGIYSESITLRDDVTIRGAESATPTLTAAASPIISASGIQSVTLSQLKIDGRGVLTAGLVMSDVNLSLDGITVRDFGGADGTAGAVDGADVTAISLRGTGSLHATSLHIAQLIAGSGYVTYTWDFEDDYRGGDATGIAVTGAYSVAIESTEIAALFAGDAGNSTDDPYGCHGKGGHAIGIATDGAAVRLDRVIIRALQGGRPCSGLARHCQFGAGAYAGVSVHAGTLSVTDSHFSDLGAYAAHASPSNAGILVHDASEMLLDSVRLEPGTTALVSDTPHGAAPVQAMAPASPDSPYCVEPPRSVRAIRAQGAEKVSMSNLRIRNVLGEGHGGQAVAISVKDAASVSLTASSIDRVSGGYEYLTTHGISLAEIGRLLINGNEIRSLTASTAPRLEELYYLNPGHNGGSAVGISARDIGTGEIANNAIWNIRGGAGASAFDTSRSATNGGDAAGIVLEEAQLTLAHNSIVQTSAGPGGSPDGQVGQSHGIRSTSSDLDLVATALAQHATALSHATGGIQLAENSFWDNAVDTVGVVPSPTDLHIDPGFVDINAGDLHLRPTSALIDRAGEYGPVSLLLDVDGQPRPLDGDGDNVYRADIGADERFEIQDVLNLQTEPNNAMFGESVGIIAVIGNRYSDLTQRGVTYASSVPAELEVLTDSLHASHGAAALVVEGDRQRVVWDGQVPPQNAVVIRYRLGVAAPSDSPGWVIMTAESAGDNAEMNQLATAKILLHPHRSHLPFASTPAK